MAKGRKLGVSRSERFLGSLGYSQEQPETVTDSSEFGEEDVWSMVDQDDHVRQVVPTDWSSRSGPESNGDRSSRNQRWNARQDHRRAAGGLSLAFEESAAKTSSPRIVHQFRSQENVESPRGQRHMAASAPVNVPDWPKILRVDSVESFHESDEGTEDDDSERMPPHEYLAREYARNGKSTATSVFEGVGRTLKGRDLSRVRDAVWSQTGFDG